MHTVVSTVADWNYYSYLAAAASVLLPVLLKAMGGLSTGGTTTYPIHLLCSKTKHQEREKKGESPFLSPPLPSIPVRRSLTGSKKKKPLPFPVVFWGFIWVSFGIFGLFATFVLEVVLRLCNLWSNVNSWRGEALERLTEESEHTAWCRHNMYAVFAACSLLFLSASFSQEFTLHSDPLVGM